MQQGRMKEILFLQYFQEGEIVSQARGEGHNHSSKGHMTKSPRLSRVSHLPMIFVKKEKNAFLLYILEKRFVLYHFCGRKV